MCSNMLIYIIITFLNEQKVIQKRNYISGLFLMLFLFLEKYMDF